MQIKLHLHLLSLWPFMPHIESGNKSLIEFMKHKSRTNPGADPVTSLVPLPASASRWLPVIWHASLSNRRVWHRASSFKGQKSDLKSISRARDDSGDTTAVCLCLCVSARKGRLHLEIPTLICWSIPSQTESPRRQIRHQTQRLLPPPRPGSWWLSSIRYEYECGIFDWGKSTELDYVEDSERSSSWAERNMKSMMSN